MFDSTIYTIFDVEFTKQSSESSFEKANRIKPYLDAAQKDLKEIMKCKPNRYFLERYFLIIFSISKPKRCVSFILYLPISCTSLCYEQKSTKDQFERNRFSFLNSFSFFSELFHIIQLLILSI